MTVLAINTNVGTTYSRVPRVRVETAESLAGSWTHRPNLYVDEFDEKVAPAIGEAKLTYKYGTILQPEGTAYGTVTPLDLEGLYVHFSLRDWEVDDAGTDLGLWNATTNSPALTSGVGTVGDFYIVSVQGATVLDGINSWRVGQAVYFDGTAWKKGVEWYGIIEVDHRSPHGSQGGISAGTQAFTAYQLLRLLEKYTIATAVIRNVSVSLLGTWNASTNTPTLASGVGTDGDAYEVDVAGSTTLDGISSWAVGDVVYFNGLVWIKLPKLLTINKGLIFNSDSRGEFPSRGNMSTATYSGTDPALPAAHIFSYQERDWDEWTAEHAANYLLTHIGPRVLSNVNWLLNVTSGNLAWNPRGAVETDRRTFKAVLDELISRHRGVGYYLSFLPSVTKPTITVEVFSYSDVAIAMPDGTTFSENPNQFSLDFEQSFDIVSCVVENKRTSQFHKVVVEGDWRTTTCTLKIDKESNELIKDWDDADETAYYAGASAESWYTAPGFTREQKNRANRESRGNDKLSAVFRRFRVCDFWTGEAGGEFVFRKVNTEPESYTLPDESEVTWYAGLQILDKLPLRERYDYSGTHIEDEDWQTTATVSSEPPFLEPFTFSQTDMPRAGAWEMLDNIDADVADEPGKRKWHVNTTAHHDRPAIVVDVTGKPQHFLARTDFLAAAPPAADYDKDEDPAANFGLDWFDCQVTLTFEMTERCRIEQIITTPETGELERVLRLRVHDCRLDYVVPGTVVAIVNGDRQLSDGGFVRDDRKKLENYAAAAALWYGRTRQTLTLGFRQVAAIVNLGDLIVDVGATYNKTDVNSVVSSQHYDMLAIKTQFETSYAEWDMA